jgi:hypothetical protein
VPFFVILVRVRRKQDSATLLDLLRDRYSTRATFLTGILKIFLNISRRMAGEFRLNEIHKKSLRLKFSDDDVLR